MGEGENQFLQVPIKYSKSLSSQLCLSCGKLTVSTSILANLACGVRFCLQDQMKDYRDGSAVNEHLFPTVCIFSSRGSDALFCCPWAPLTYVVHNHTCRQNTYMHKIRAHSTQGNLPEFSSSHATQQGDIYK